MCIVSMIMDHYWDKWTPKPSQPNPYFPNFPGPTVFPNIPGPTVFPTITKEEVEEFRRLLERARIYDKENNQPNCEMEEKKQRLKKLADELGIKIDFL